MLFENIRRVASINAIYTSFGGGMADRELRRILYDEAGDLPPAPEGAANVPDCRAQLPLQAAPQGRPRLHTKVDVSLC